MKITFTTGLGIVLGSAEIPADDIDLFKIIGKISKHTCVIIENEIYDNHSKITSCKNEK